MDLFKREKYLKKIRGFYDADDIIKVITGMRRSGKSKLLEAFMDYVIKTVPDANIIHLNFSLAEFEGLLEWHRLNEYVENKYIADKQNFLFIDEVQMCDGFEKAVNSFHASEKFDIYITGSNAFLLSSDLATLFTGRTFEIEVFPFSFKEYMQYFETEDRYAAFGKYLKEGGLSGSYLYSSQEAKYDYVDEVFKTLIIRDIQKKYKNCKQ